MAEIDKVLMTAIQAGASDVHLATGNPVCIRQYGVLRRMKSPELTPETAKKLIYEILSPSQRKVLEQNLQIDFSYDIKGKARFRGNAVLQRLGLNATFRIIPTKVPTFEQLGLPPAVQKFCDYHQGLVLVTGATGQGKSTTLAAMIDYINSTRPDHIISIEDPIEFLHPIKKGVVNQRQLHKHTRSFANALRGGLRQDPDVIVVGELRDLESIELAVTASETGHLVLATMSTSTGPKTVDRIIDSFPAQEQNQIRIMLAEGLRAVVTQMLVPRKDGKGRVLACEILVCTAPMSNLIRSEKTYQIPSIMQTGRSIGMQTMDESLMELCKAGKIAAEAAYQRAASKQRFKQLLQS